jgi:hypothetical protein
VRAGEVQVDSRDVRAVDSEVRGTSCKVRLRGMHFFCWMRGFVATAAAANHLRGAGAIRLGIEVVGVVAAGVISGIPPAFFFQKFGG